MSQVTEVLAEIESRGLSVTVSGADLRLQGPKERMDPELVGRIKAVKPELVGYLSRPPEPEPEGFALTPLQRGYLIGRGDAVELGGVASHVYHEIEGCWDLDRLEAALRSVVARHGMLRTRFTADGRQIEQESADIRIGRLDLRGQPAERQSERRLALRKELSHRVLPADRAPLLAADVTLLADDRMVLHVGHDGLVMDGISMFLFFREWWTAYTQDGAEATEEASFEAYIAALEKARTRAPAERSRTYWLDRIDDLAPHPDLPLRTSPSAIATTRFTQHSARLDAAAWASVKARAAGSGLTPTVLLLAAYAETLARWGAGSRFTLTTTVANRPPIHPRINHAIGNFSETLLVEVEIDRRLTFQERARALQARLRRDLDHRHFSGIEVLRELARRTGAGQAQMPYTFNSAIGYVQADLDGSTLELFGPEVSTSSQTPQLWLNAFAFEQHGGVIVQFDAVDGLFPEGLVQDMVAGYQTLLTSLLDEDAWTALTFDLLPEAQRERRRKANDTARPMADVRLTDAFLAQAEAAPDAPAIITCQGTTTYGELARRARSAAAWLQARQVQRDELVGLVMTRGPEQVVGILATLLAGGAYLPIDAALPEERKRYMLRDGRVRCVLTNAGWQGSATEVLSLDMTTEPADGEPLQALPDGAGPDDLAYVLYTSGTTGEPKGVMVSHRNVANVVADCNERFGIGAQDRFFGISAFNFDLSVYDVFGALSAGAAIVLPDADRAADPAHWLELCAQAGVTVWNSVPAIVALLCEQAAMPDAAGADPLAALRLVMMSGDRIPPELPVRLWRLKNEDELSVISLGGPTETTIWNISHPVGSQDDGSRSIPYGRPNANNQAYILDADGLDAPDWVTGEICAAGTGLARGYWGDAARTAERFFDDERRGVRLYRTGDLGCYLPDGEIAIQGRGDFQLKVNGYRVEAGEVETRLAAIDAVKEAVVVCRPGAPDAAIPGDRLVAHLVAAGDERPDVASIREQLGEHLPVYMTPSALVWHESLPLTRNGKVDRAALLAAAPSAAGPGNGAATATASATANSTTNAELEQALTGIWASVLRVPETAIAPDLDFYDLGGESLAAARILTKVRKQFGVGITLERMHEVRTVRAMAAHVEAAGRTGRTS